MDLAPGKQRRNRRKHLFRKHRLTIAQYDQMLQAQGGVCAICHQPEMVERNRHLAVDHDHRTGRIRGLLCLRCNRGLGLFLDLPERLRAAASYLVS